MANKSSITIDVALKTDVKGLLSDIDDIILQAEQKVGSVKTLGLTRGAKNDVAAIEGMIAGLKKEIDNLSHSKLNTTTFSKAQQAILQKVEELEKRTTALESGMASFIDTMSKADGSKFASQMKDISDTMQSLANATTTAVTAMRDLSDVSDETTHLQEMSSAIQAVKDAFDKTPNVQKFKTEEEAIKKINEELDKYADIQDEILNIQENFNGSKAQEKELLKYQAQLVATGDKIQEMMDKASLAFGQSFFNKKDKMGISFEAITDSIQTELDDIQYEVEAKSKDISKKLTEAITNASSKVESDPVKVTVKPVVAKNSKTDLQKQVDNISDNLSVTISDVTVASDDVKDIAENITEAVVDTANSAQSAISNEMKDIGMDAVDAVEKGILSQEENLKKTWVKVFHGISYGADDAKFKTHKGHDIFFTEQEKTAKSYAGSSGSVNTAYLDTSKFFNLRGYGFNYSDLPKLGNGITEESKEVISLYNKIIDDLHVLENLDDEVLGTNKLNGFIQEFENKTTGEIVALENSSTSFAKQIKSSSFVEDLKSAFDGLSGGAKEALNNFISDLDAYRNFIDSAKDHYGGKTSVRHYEEFLQESAPGVYSGIHVTDVYDNPSGGGYGNLNTEWVVFDQAMQNVLQAAYAVKGVGDTYTNYQDRINDLLGKISSTKMGKIEKEILLKTQQLNSSHQLLDDPTEDKNYHLQVIEDTQKELEDLITQKMELKERLDNMSSYIEQLNAKAKTTGKSNGFDGILKTLDDLKGLPSDIQGLLKVAGMVDDFGNSKMTQVSGGFTNKGVYQNDEITIIERPLKYLPKIDSLIPKLKEVAKQGVSVGEIIGKVVDEENDLLYDIQTTVHGSTVTNSNDYLKATDDQIQKLYDDIKKLNDIGLYVDVGGENILYDEKTGFSFIDLMSHITESNKDVTAPDAKSTIDRFFKNLNEGFYNRIYEVVDELSANATNSTKSYANNKEMKDALDDLELEFKTGKELIELFDELHQKGDALAVDVGEKLEELGYYWNKFSGQWEEDLPFDDSFEDTSDVVDKAKRSLDDFIKEVHTASDTSEELNKLADGFDELEGEFVQLGKAEDILADDTSIDNFNKKYSDLKETLSNVDDFDDADLAEDIIDTIKSFEEYSKEHNFMWDTITQKWVEVEQKADELADDVKQSLLRALGDDLSPENFNKVLLDIYDQADQAMIHGWDNDDIYDEQIEALKKYADQLGYVSKELIDAEGFNYIGFAEPDKISDTSEELNKLAEGLDELNTKAKEAEQSTETSIDGIDKETQDFVEVSEAAEKAALSKEDFVTANAEVLKSIIDSLKGLGDEGKAFEQINKMLNNFGGSKGSDKLEQTKIGLQEIITLLSQNVDDSSFIKALQKISESGSNLSDIATILKASKKELLQAQQVLNDLGSDALDDLLQNHAQEIVANAKAELVKLGGTGSQFVNISGLNKTKDGLIEIVGLIKTADNNMQEFTLHTKDGIQMQNVGMNENTAKIAKQMKIYAQVQQYFDKMKAQGKNITDQPFFDKNSDPAIWKMLIDYAKAYHAELGEIQSITMQTRQDSAGSALFESFSLNGTNGHLTVGREGETVASNQQLLNVEELQKRIIALTKSTKEYYNLIQKKDSVGWSKADETALQNIRDEYEDIVKLVREYSDVLGDSTNISTVFADAMNQMTVSYNNMEQAYINKAQKVLTDAFDNPNNKNVAYTASFMNELDEAIAKVQELQTILNAHGDNNAPWSDDEIAKVKELHADIDATVGSVKDLENVMAKSSSIDKLLTKINKDLNDNSAMPKELKAQYIALRDEIDEARKSLDGLNKVDFSALESSFNSLHQKLTRTGKLGKNVVDKIADAAQSQTVQFLARYFSLQDMVRYTREMAQNVINIDTALTELRKVSDASTERLSQSFEKSTKTAQELGQTIQHVINVTADWARLGYNVDEAEELARVTALFTSVGDNMSADDASSYLISTLQGFQMGADQAEDIVDRYNQVANNFAIDTAGIGESLKRSAASFNAANTDLSEAIALVTATNEVLQNPESVGTLWKTMSARIRGAKTELQELGEEEDDFTNTTSKLRDLVMSLTGFDIMIDEDTFKSVYEIVLGIGKEWDKLTDIERASLGEALAGKRNANGLYAVLGNLDTLQEAYEAAENAAGSAAKEQENYAKSVQYSIDRFKASIEELSYDFLNSNLLKDLVEAGNTVIQVLDKIVENFGSVEIAVGIASTVLGVKFRKEIGSSLVDVIDKLGKTTKATDTMIDALDGGAAVLEAVQQGAELGADGMLRYSDSIVKTSKALGLLKLGGIAVGIAAVTTALYIGYKAWDEYQTTVEEWNDKIDETTNKISSLETEIKNLQNIDFRTQEEQKRLDILKQELEYEKLLLETQKERAAVQAYGFNSPAQQWDSDNAVKKWQKELDSQAHIGAGMEMDEYFGMEYNAGMLSKAADDVRKYDEQLAKLSVRSEEYGEILEEKQKTESEAAEYLQTLKIKTGDYYEELKKAKDATQYLEVGSNAYIHNQQLIESYQEMIDLNEQVIESYQKATGTYDYSSVVSSLFQHTEYEKVEEELVKIAKAGDLTKESLQFNKDPLIQNLISDLVQAGADADVLYQYILKIAGVVDKENLIDKINNSIVHNSGGGNVSGYEYDYKKIAEYINSLNDEQLQILAGLDIDWSTFDADEFIAKAQSEIDKAGKLEVEPEIKTDSITKNISDLNDLENALNNVGNAIANIDENGNFQLGDLDSIADYFLGLETAEKKVEYETEAVANALKLLGEGGGSVQEQANAINTLADNYLRTSGILDGLNEKNKELYITRLNSMGIINAEEIVLATLNAQLDAEAQARAIVALQAEAEAQAKELIANETVNLTNLTAEEINALLEEGTITQETALKLLDMAIQKQMVNGTVLTTSGDIANLTALCTSLGVAGSALERYAEMKRIAMDDTGKYTPEYQAGTMERANQMLQNAIKAAYNSGGAEYNIPKVQYNGGSPVKNKLGYTPSSTADAISGAATKAAKDAADAAKGAAEDAKEEFKETIDFFERMIKVLDQSISLLKAHLEDVVGSFAKNTLIDAQEAQIRKKMEGYSSAIEMYSAKASEALSKVPSDVAAKLQSGAVAIDEFIGEENKEVVEAAQEYEQWADKVADCKQQLVELREELRQLELQKFKNIAQDFQELFDVRQTQIDLIDKAISLFESASDKIVGRSFYDVKIDQTSKQLSKLLEKRTALTNQMSSAIANGIEVANDEWFEMLEAVEGVNAEILDSQKNIEDYKNAIVQLYVDAFDRESNRYTNQIALRQKAISALEKQISIIQSAGNLAGTAFFEKQIEQNRKSLDMLQAERQELMRRMSDATANGVRVGTDEWYSMVDALNAVDSAIQDCEESINSLDDAILALHTATFERIQSRFESLASEMSNMTDMFEGMDVATVDNKWTKEGLAQLGLLAQQYELVKKQVAQYNTEIEELNSQYAAGKYSVTEYTEKLAELKSSQWEEVKAAKSAKDSIMSLNEARVEIVVKGINEEIEAYQKLIDEQKKLLSTEKDLHDYEKSISKSTQAVQDVERQLAALADDNSLAAAAKRAKLEEELRNAREDLAEQEYAHSVEVQQEALDEQLENYRETRELEIETLQESLENEEQIIQESFDRVKENTALIGSEILTMAQSLNITMSEEITAPWQSGENAIASYSSLMNIESSNFIMRLNEVENSEWRLQEQANNSSVAIADMFANQSDNLVAQTEAANAQFRQEEADAQNASAAIANAFGQRADSLVQTIEDARNSTANLTNMSNALADSLSKSIDGSYSGASAASALESIADAARDVGNAASEAVGKVRELIEAQSEYSRKSDDSSHVTTVYGGPDAGKTASWKWDKNGQIQITSGVRNHYAQGTKGVSRSQLAWTQEDGPEAIINPSDGSILTPLQRGSAVLPADQTSNIWQWSRFDPETFAKQLALNVPKTGSNVQANTLQIGNLVNVSGNVNDTMEMMQIAATTASAKIKQSFNQLSNGLNK